MVKSTDPRGGEEFQSVCIDMTGRYQERQAAQTQRYLTGERLDVWQERLPNLFFYPVHKSFLVNLHYVAKYAYSEVYLADGERIPVAPRRQAAFHKYWFEYLRRR